MTVLLCGKNSNDDKKQTVLIGSEQSAPWVLFQRNFLLLEPFVSMETLSGRSRELLDSQLCSETSSSFSSSSCCSSCSSRKSRATPIQRPFEQCRVSPKLRSFPETGKTASPLPSVLTLNIPRASEPPGCYLFTLGEMSGFVDFPQRRLADFIGFFLESELSWKPGVGSEKVCWLWDLAPPPLFHILIAGSVGQKHRWV